MSARASRRQVLALITLADAPMPVEIVFRDDARLLIEVDRIVDLRPWAKVFGVDAKTLTSALKHRSNWKKSDGQQMVSAWLHTDWQGWNVSLDADEPAAGGVDQLDDTMREQLAAIAAEPVAIDSNPCPYTQSHTREFCGNPTCRES